jgi:hypothetical protein
MKNVVKRGYLINITKRVYFVINIENGYIIKTSTNGIRTYLKIYLYNILYYINE